MRTALVAFFLSLLTPFTAGIKMSLKQIGKLSRKAYEDLLETSPKPQYRDQYLAAAERFDLSLPSGWKKPSSFGKLTLKEIKKEFVRFILFLFFHNLSSSLSHTGGSFVR